MPYTRAIQLRAPKGGAKSRDMLQMQNLTSNMGWNDYPDGDLPEFTYHPDTLTWFPNESAITGQPQFFTDSQSTMADAANSLREPKSEKASNLYFCGLAPWYSTGIQESSSISPTAIIRPRLSGSEFKSFESTSLEEESQLIDQPYSSQAWSPNMSRQLSFMSDGALSRVPCISPTVDLTQQLDDAPSRSSEDENARGNTARVEASKKRKIAHSVIERNYRSRIKNGMAELRDCVPSTARGRSSVDPKRPGSRQIADDAAPKQSSGKFATLSDAVQYVKSLELEGKALHGRLEVMQRRNKTLQKIATSKANTNTPATLTNIETIDEEDTSRAGKQEKQGKQMSRSWPCRA